MGVGSGFKSPSLISSYERYMFRYLPGVAERFNRRRELLLENDRQRREEFLKAQIRDFEDKHPEYPKDRDGVVRIIRKQEKASSRARRRESLNSNPSDIDLKPEKLNPVTLAELPATLPKASFDEYCRRIRKGFFKFHPAAGMPEFIDWFNSIAQQIFDTKKYKVSYGHGAEAKSFIFSPKEWLSWLFSNSSPGLRKNQKLTILGNSYKNAFFGIGNFHELRVAVALFALKATGQIADFVLSVKNGKTDALGIDGLIILSKKDGMNLTLPYQVKSFDGKFQLHSYSEAAHPYKPNTKLLRDIPTIGALGKSISDLTAEITDLISAASLGRTKKEDLTIAAKLAEPKNERLLKLRGDFDAISVKGKIRLLSEQGFMKTLSA